MNEMFWHKAIVIWIMAIFTILILGTVGLAFVDALNQCTA